MTGTVDDEGARNDGALPLALFDPTPSPDTSPRPGVAPSRADRRRAQGPMLPLAWPCSECSAEVAIEGAVCRACQERRRAREQVLWKIEIALGIELGEDVHESLWRENEGDDPQGEIAARGGPADAAAMSARAYDAWCERYWRHWGMRRRWSGLPPELPLERWVETLVLRPADGAVRSRVRRGGPRLPGPFGRGRGHRRLPVGALRR